jgi:hypothetical protein
MGGYDRLPIGDLEDVMWREPKGWQRPEWLTPAPCEATLPMTPERFRWCQHAIGWSRGTLAKRSHSATSTIRRLETGERSIADALAVWMESQIPRVLTPVDPETTMAEAFWRQPEGWARPPWLRGEWCPALEPMCAARMLWCLSVTGWALYDVAHRFGHGLREGTLHEMLDVIRPIPLDLGIWMEVHTARTLSLPMESPPWRSWFQGKPGAETS